VITNIVLNTLPTSVFCASVIYFHIVKITGVSSQVVHVGDQMRIKKIVRVCRKHMLFNLPVNLVTKKKMNANVLKKANIPVDYAGNYTTFSCREFSSSSSIMNGSIGTCEGRPVAVQHVALYVS